MREKFARFMAGRYGVDQLNKAMLAVCAVMLIIAMIFNGTRVAALLWLLAFALLVLSYFRMLSKNTYRRAGENNRYLRVMYSVKKEAIMAKERWVQRKDYKFFRCPACRTSLRVPKGKGKVNIVCRKCGNSFTGKT